MDKNLNIILDQSSDEDEYIEYIQLLFHRDRVSLYERILFFFKPDLFKLKRPYLRVTQSDGFTFDVDL